MIMLRQRPGGNDPEGWILWDEQYFTCLGFSQKDWLPLPYFYLDGEALTWFTWLHRNKQFFDWKHFKEKLLMRFPQHTTSWKHRSRPYARELPEKYTNVDSLALLTGSDAEIATLEGLGTPQIGNEKSVESDLVRFCKDISMQTKFPTSVLTDTKESNSVEEKKSLDNAALFDKSPQRDASGTLAPFTKQAPVLSNMHIRITEIV
ncbi:hypothetical protein KY284_015675 [Solanum tuberosum]|nr:hypothetical protein KY284_015675 [Solanum tuberosum]